MGLASMAENQNLPLVGCSWENFNLGPTLKERFHRTLQMCAMQPRGESMEHILNLCPFSRKAWDRGASLFRISDRI